MYYTTVSRRMRAFAALPILLILLVLAACSKPSQAVPAPYKGTVTLWASPGLAGHPVKLEEGWLEERTKGFEAAHPGVTVQIRTFTTGEELEQALLGNTEPKPDLYLGRPLPALSGKLAALPLKPALVSDHHEPVLAAYRKGEALSGLPLLLDLQVLVVNDAALASGGLSLPADGRITVAYLTENLGKLTGNGRFALGFSHAPGYHQWWPLLDGLFTADGTTTPGAEEALHRLADWRKAGYLYPDIASLTTEESMGLFAANPPTLAMIPVGAWTIPLLRGEPYRATFTVAGFPNGTAAGYAYGLTAFAADQPEKLAAMAQLVEFLAAPDQQVRLARKTGLMPARKSAPNPFEGDSQMSRAFQFTSSFRPLPAGPAWDAAQKPIARELLLALYGGKKPKAALEAAKTAITPAK